MYLNNVFQIESSRAMVDYGSLDSAAGHSENLGSKLLRLWISLEQLRPII